jgi:Divergent InlB B-repeat domain/PASTA domain
VQTEASELTIQRSVEVRRLRKPESVRMGLAIPVRTMKRRTLRLAMAAAVIAVVAAAFQAHLAGASHVAPFVGTWQNDNAATRQQKRAVIGVNGANFEVWGYGACGGGECDWASSVGGPRTTPQADAADGQLSIIWEFGFARFTQTLTLLPDERLHITSFTQFLDGSGRRDYWSNEDFHKTTPTAVFHTLGVAASGGGRGKVTSSPAGLDCPSTCSLEFQSGTSVVLTATPDSGSRLAAWTGACTGRSPICTVPVDSDQTATAVFSPKPPCVVPALTRKTLAGARRTLISAHCRLAAVKHAYSRRAKRGRVVAQKPAAGTKLPNAGGVSVVISRGPRRDHASK